MSTVKSHIPLLLGLAALAGACTTTAGSARPYPDIRAFCAARAKAECQVAALCAADASACLSARTTLCIADAAKATAGSSSRKYVADNAAACIDAVTRAYGNASTGIPFAELVGKGSITDTCERVFSGNLDANQACGSDYDCVSGRICASGAGSTLRVCADAVSKAEGAPCSDPGATCATDTYCALPAPDAGYPQCQPALQAGPCSASAPCVSTDRCVSGLCVARAASGHPCASNDDCAPSAPYCDPDTGNICTPGVSFAALAPDCKPYGLGGGQDAGAVAADAGDGATHDASAAGDASDASGE